jgi:gp45 sliding clamp, C terminal
MKFSDKTIKILQNFTSINQSLSFKEGKKLRTISPMQNVFAEAEIEEYIPKDFAIYDLPQFLNTVGLYKDPDIDVSSEESYASIKEGKANRSKYFFSDPSVIIAPPDREMKLPSEDICFVLQEDQLQKILKSSSILGLPDLSAVGEAGVIKLVVNDRKNDTSNEYSIVVGETNAEFSFNFKIENIKLIPGSYEVVISKSKLARFYSERYNLTYFIALEPDSIFGG